ncbi:MAG: SDR family oxidoreductase, partial [Clostridiales bacterium]|nr:SDR family oxidoreductase [Clostridiales bacterium]
YKKIDINEEESVNELINDIEKNHGQIWAWINLAYPRTKDWGDKLEDIKIDSFRKNVDLQLNSQFICCRAILEVMKKRNNGVVINCSSIYGLQGPNFNVYEGTEMTMPAAYSAIKSGIINLTKYLAAYYGKYNLRINCVAPGGVFDGQNPVFVENYNKLTPLGRMGSAEEIAAGFIFLISNEAGYITGQTLIIDGGFTIW